MRWGLYRQRAPCPGWVVCRWAGGRGLGIDRGKSNVSGASRHGSWVAVFGGDGQHCVAEEEAREKAEAEAN